MSVVSDILFGIRCIGFLISASLHILYQLVVFLSKPGAALIVAYLMHAITLYMQVESKGVPYIDLNASVEVWYEQVIKWLTIDRQTMGSIIYLEMGLLIGALSLHIFPSPLLRAALGLFPAKARPLPPIRKVRVPKFKVKSVRVRCHVKSIRKRFFRGPYSLKRRLPKQVAVLIIKPRSV